MYRPIAYRFIKQQNLYPCLLFTGQLQAVLTGTQLRTGPGQTSNYQDTSDLNSPTTGSNILVRLPGLAQSRGNVFANSQPSSMLLPSVSEQAGGVVQSSTTSPVTINTINVGSMRPTSKQQNNATGSGITSRFKLLS